MNRRHGIFLMSALIAFLPIGAHAQDASIPAALSKEEAKAPSIETPPKGLERAGASALRAKANQEIEKRFKAFDAARTRISGLKKLSIEQKTSFIASLDEAQKKLEEIESAVQLETDTTKLRALYSSVFQARILAIVIPKQRGLAVAANNIAVVSDLEQTLSKLQESAGAYAELKQTMSALSDSLSQARSLSAASETLLSPLEPSNYPAKEQFVQHVKNTKDAVAQVKKAREHIKKANKLLAKLKKGSKQSTGTNSSGAAVSQTMPQAEKKSEENTQSAQKQAAPQQALESNAQQPQNSQATQVVPSQPQAQVPQPQPTVITRTDTGFAPGSVTVKTGTAVTFKNESSQQMWVASAVHPSHQIYPEFDQRQGSPKGTEYSFIFTKVGTWKYHDHLNPGLRGEVTVTE